MENIEEENWRIKSNRPGKVGRGISSFKDRENWITTSKEKERKETAADNQKPVNSRKQRRASRHRQTLSKEDLLPSQVMEEEYIYFPSDPESIDNMKSATAGKWLIYGNYSMTSHDEAWTKLLPLCQEGILIGMKASTSIITDAQQFMGGEVILCYTSNADDVHDVKKAGDAIRRTIGYGEEILFYKTNAASVEGLYNIEGVKAVTKYRLTPEGSFDTRDSFKRWIPVKMEGLS